MKVLGICCGRKNGNTEIMMKEAFKAICEKIDAECQFVRLQEVEIRSCIGCGQPPEGQLGLPLCPQDRQRSFLFY